MPNKSGTLTVAETKAARRDRISNRSLALIEQALDRVLRNDGKDAVERLAKAFDDNPMAWMDWLAKQAAEPGVTQNTSNINQLFLLTAKQAAQSLPIVDVEAKPVLGVQPGSGDSEPIDW